MYKDMYNTFDDKCIPYDYSFSFEDNRKDYMVGNVPTLEMDCGDTAVFPFFILEPFRHNDIVITIFNNRYEKVYEVFTEPDEEGKVYLKINNELTAKLYKGNYYIRLQAQEQKLYLNNNCENDCDSCISHCNEFEKNICTILPAKDCSLYVK